MNQCNYCGLPESVKDWKMCYSCQSALNDYARLEQMPEQRLARKLNKHATQLNRIGNFKAHPDSSAAELLRLEIATRAALQMRGRATCK